MRIAIALALALIATPALAAELTLYKSPSCGCCQGWAEYMQGQGWKTKVVDVDEIERIKRRHGVPARMESCHTAIIDGYVVEGHVPVAAIDKLLKERPRATGLSAPGMPQGSPGMSGTPEPYVVYLFGPDGAKPFMRF
ncbi:MAG: metal-binding [Rhodospirillaceae bacterium]|nr:MAG: metal-binding [Rhodospirillaceae bacterium]TNC96406.1 MAG: metal-binding protein [Stygiobacter sp.]